MLKLKNVMASTALHMGRALHRFIVIGHKIHPELHSRRMCTIKTHITRECIY